MTMARGRSVIIKQIRQEGVRYMIRVIAGGKKHQDWVNMAIFEYGKRLKKPFNVEWQFFEEDKLLKYLEGWPFSGHEFVIVLDERGINISSVELANKLNQQFVDAKDVVILIGGAFGFTDEIRARANFVWSFSKLVFPHQLVRVMLSEQIYRAQEINLGGKYHHE